MEHLAERVGLLLKSVNYGHNKFYRIGPRCCAEKSGSFSRMCKLDFVKKYIFGSLAVAVRLINALITNFFLFIETLE